MSTKMLRSLDMLHPVLRESHLRIVSNVIEKHNAPFRLFETGRDADRHQALLHKGLTQKIMSRHLYDLGNEPPLYATAVAYVYYSDRWSWNLRDNSILNWYKLFGELVLDICPELVWGGTSRKAVDYTYFELRERIILDNIDKYPCVMP